MEIEIPSWCFYCFLILGNVVVTRLALRDIQHGFAAHRDFSGFLRLRHKHVACHIPWGIPKTPYTQYIFVYTPSDIYIYIHIIQVNMQIIDTSLMWNSHFFGVQLGPGETKMVNHQPSPTSVSKHPVQWPSTIYLQMGVSKNRENTPKWMVYNGKPY